MCTTWLVCGYDSSWLLSRRFTIPSVSQAKAQLELMQRACAELEACDDFVTLLQEVLQTGNRLNEGTQRGAAAGVL